MYKNHLSIFNSDSYEQISFKTLLSLSGVFTVVGIIFLFDALLYGIMESDRIG